MDGMKVRKSKIMQKRGLGGLFAWTRLDHGVMGRHSIMRW